MGWRKDNLTTGLIAGRNGLGWAAALCCGLLCAAMLSRAGTSYVAAGQQQGGEAPENQPAASQGQTEPQAQAEEAQPTSTRHGRPLLYDELPYRIRVLFCFDPDAQLTPRFRSSVIRQFQAYVATYVGDAWQLACEDASDSLATSGADQIERLGTERIKRWSDGVEKVFVIGLRFGGDRYLLAAREFDATFDWWGPTVSRAVREPTQVARELVRLCADMFAPQARMEEGDNRRARILVRGGRLPCFDPNGATGSKRPAFLFIQPGDLFRPMFREYKEDADGNRVLVRIRPVPWTFYRLERYRAGKGTCRVYSALRDPLPSRSRDPLESHMLVVRTAGGSTELRLVSRTDHTPLPAVDILVRESVTGAPIPLGTTDLDGRIRIPPMRSGTSLVIVYVRHGGTTLAKLPIVPGAGPEPELSLRPDPVRLQIEGYVLPIQEQIIDLVAKRKILEQRIRAAIKKKQWQTADELIKKLKAMPTKEDMLAKLEEVRRVADEMRGPGVPQTPKVRRILSETKQAIEVFFDPDEFLDLVDELEDLLASERDAAEAAEQQARRAGS